LAREESVRILGEKQMIRPKQWTETSNKIFKNEGKKDFPRYLWFSNHMNSPADLLEIGFNSGEALSWFADKGFRCTGIDLPRIISEGSDSRIRYIAQNMDEPNGESLAEFFPPTDRFDYIICAEVLQHLLFDENCLYAIWHYLKPDGRLLLSTECKNLVYHGFRYYNIYGLTRTLETLQFKVEDVSITGQDGYVWICARKVVL